MMLMLVLLIFPHIRAFVSNTYNGFDDCGIDGWICDGFLGTEMIFDCSKARSQRGRIWVWTARLPSTVRKLTARNCLDLELHVDCTRNKRDNAIQEVSLINITYLEILKPTDTHQYLHDNEPVAHVPPVFHLQNVSFTRFYEGLFHNESSKCYYNSGTMKKMIMEDVRVHDIPRKTFLTEVNELSWTNVIVQNILQDSITLGGINGTIKMENCHLPLIPTDSIKIKGENVIFAGNKMEELLPSAIQVNSYNFTFRNNVVKEIMNGGLSIKSSHVNIENNAIHHIAKDALKDISPAYYPNSIPYTFTYRFVGNEFITLSPFSLHCSWDIYEKTCFKFTIDGNKFDCTCTNFAWLKGFINGNKSMENYSFYKNLLNTTHHCGTSTNCTLSAIIPYVCNDEENLHTQCSGLHEKENFDSLAGDKFNFSISNDSTIPPVYEGFVPSEVKAEYEIYENKRFNSTDSQKKTLDKSYYTDQSISMNESENNFPSFIITPTFIIIGALGGLVLLVLWYKRKKNHNPVHIYKYEKNNDHDNLIVNTKTEVGNVEYENNTYHE